MLTVVETKLMLTLPTVRLDHGDGVNSGDNDNRSD